jgi:hypothetical protein
MKLIHTETSSQHVPTKPFPHTVRNLVQLGFWAPSMAFLRRCHEAGIAVHLMPLGDGPSTSLIQNSRSPSATITSMGERIPWGMDKSPQSLETVLKFINLVQAEAISSDDEATLLWLAHHRASFEPSCRVMTSPASSMERLLKKSEQASLATQSGFSVLPTWLIETKTDAEIPAETSFPLCLRPTRMSSVLPAFKARCVVTRSQLHAFLNELQWTSPLIAQPFCLGPNLVLHGVRKSDGQILALECFRTVRKHHGFALTIERCPTPPSVHAAATRFAELADLHGAFHFDLLQSAETGEVYFLEVNYRMGGTTAKVVRMGFDEPMLALQAFDLCPPLPPKPLPRRKRATGKRMLVGSMLESLHRPPSELDYPQDAPLHRFFSNAFQLLTVPDALLSWKDLRGSFWYLRYGGRM